MVAEREGKKRRRGEKKHPHFYPSVCVSVNVNEVLFKGGIAVQQSLSLSLSLHASGAASTHHHPPTHTHTLHAVR